MPSALEVATRERTHLRRTRHRLLSFAVGLAAVEALLPATASAAVKFDGADHSRARPTRASTHARLLSDATIVEYGSAGRASSVSRSNTSPGSAAPGRASSLPAYKLVANSGNTALGVRANGYGKPVILISHGATTWVFVNDQRWTNLSGQLVDVAELQHAGTDACINYAQEGVYEMASCVKGDNNELFWAVPPGSTIHGSPNYWYINVAPSDAARDQYIFLTASRLTDDAVLVARGPGFGGLAAWNRKCTANC